VTHRPGRIAAAIRHKPVWRTASGRLSQTCGAIGDYSLAVMIVLAAIAAWAPRVGVAAARETLGARRETRARVAVIHTRSAVWARQARRNALGWQRNADLSYRRTRFDP